MGIIESLKAQIRREKKSSHVPKSKKQRWKEYPVELEEHYGHERSTTMARYGAFVVCYCYDCEQHYRQLKANVTEEN